MTTSNRLDDPLDANPPTCTRTGMETMSEADRLRVARFVLDVAVGPDELFSFTGCATRAEPAEAAITQIVRSPGASNQEDQSIPITAMLPCGHRGLLSSAYVPAVDRPAGEALRLMGTDAPGPAPDPTVGQ